MKKVVLFIISVFISHLFLYSCDSNKFEEKENTIFRSQVVRALDLQYVNKDSLYLGSYTRVFNDTIVGCRNYLGYGDPGRQDTFFIQSLKNLRFRLTFTSDDIKVPVQIDALKNSCLYFGAFSQSFMISICADGKTREYFRSYQDTMFYANKIMLYKDKTVVVSMNGVFIYRTESEKLLWQYRFISEVESTWASEINGKLVFLECPGSKINKPRGLVNCYDLDKMSMTWQKELKTECVMGAGGLYQEYQYIPHTDKELFLRNNKGVRVLRLSDGNTNYTDEELESLYPDESNHYYGTVDNSIVCLDAKYQKLWRVKNVRLWGRHGSNIVAITPDGKYFIIINKKDGHVSARIINDSKRTSIGFVDNYILINGIYLYK